MKKRTIYKTLFITLPFILAFPFHFLFEYVKFPLLVIYFPVNESIFEHIKLTFTPIILTYLSFYIFLKSKLDLKRYFSSLIISISISFVTMLILFYGYRLFTVKDITILSILSLFIGLSIGQVVGILTYKKGVRWSIEISVFTLLTITTLLLILTLNPPSLEFFFDKSKGVYGLY